MIEGIGVF